MTAEERKKFAPLIDLMTIRVLEGERTIDRVPPLLREEVRKSLEDTEGLTLLYVRRVLENLITVDQVPELIREKVREAIGVQSDITVLLLVSDIIAGKKQMTDVPEVLKAEVVKEIEHFTGKKLEGDSQE